MNTREIFENIRISERPTEIESFTLLKCLDTNPFSQVHQGFCRGELVAIKTMDCQVNEQDEAEILLYHKLSQLRHASQYMVTLIGYHLPEHGYSLIMRYASMGNLSDYLRAETNKDLNAAVKKHLIIHTSMAVAWLHAHGFIHRDLSSNNFLLTENLKPLLSDFTYATYCPNTITEDELIGSPYWMAPEVLASKTYNFKSDMYSLTVVHWEIMAQRLPCENNQEHLTEFYEKVINGQRLPLDPTWNKEIVECLTLGFAVPAQRLSAKRLVQRLNQLNPRKSEKMPTEIDDALIPSPIEQCTCRVL